MFQKATLFIGFSILFMYQSFSQENDSLDINNHNINIVYRGSEHVEKGVPLIVLEAGGSGSSGTWSTVIDSLSKFAPVLAYDRAGYGRSKWDGKPSTVSQTTQRLHEILVKLDIPGPFLMVSFSRGSFYVRDYVSKHPDDIAGIVYIDPSDFLESRENINTALTAIGAKPSDYQALQDLDREEVMNAPPGVKSELEQHSELTSKGANTYFDQLSPMPEVPVIVICTNGPIVTPPPGMLPFDLEEYARALIPIRRQHLLSLTENSSQGLYLEVNYLGHPIHREDPNLAIWAIRKALFPDLKTSIISRISEQGFAEGYHLYLQKKKWYPKEYFSEELLNAVGYELLWSQKVEEAIAVFRLNVVEYPAEANPFDSLGDAYLKAGQETQALEAYHNAVKLAREQDHLSLNKYEKKYNRLKHKISQN